MKSSMTMFRRKKNRRSSQSTKSSKATSKSSAADREKREKIRQLEALNDKERRWAHELDEAIYGDDNGANGDANSFAVGRVARLQRLDDYTKPSTLLYGRPSDLEIAAHAIRAKGDTKKALHRISRMKQFKDLYNIPDFFFDSFQNNSNDEEALLEQERILQLLHKFFTAYPNFIQRIGLDKYNRVVVQFRLCELRWTQPPPFNHSDEERFQALFYILNATQPTLDQIRRGTVWVGDLEGIGFELGPQQRPTPEIYKGGRLLFRDSYPIKVDDIPVVDCPPRLSKVYLGLYPFLSSHFLEKFVCVTPELLQQHFPPELLSDRLRGKQKKNKAIHKKQVRRGTLKVGNNNDETGYFDEADWENLNDSMSDLNGSSRDFNKYDDSRKRYKNKSSSIAGTTDSGVQEMWMTIERLSRMRFQTERKFRL